MAHSNILALAGKYWQSVKLLLEVMFANEAPLMFPFMSLVSIIMIWMPVDGLVDTAMKDEQQRDDKSVKTIH